MNDFARSFLLACAVVVIAADAASAAGTLLQAADDRGASATLVLRGAPLVSMTEIPFRLELAGLDQGTTIDSAVCSLTMPAMPMPENSPPLTCDGNACIGRAVFTMAGAWQATFDLNKSDGTSASLVFDIDMVRMK